MHKKRVVGLALSAIAIALLAGCQAFSPGTIGLQERATVQTASQQLADAVARTKGVDLKFTARGGPDSLTGGYDSKSRAAGFNHNNGLAFVSTADLLYVKGASGVADGTWARMATGNLAAACRFSAAADPVFGLSLVLAATSTQQSSEFGYTGRLDLARVTGSVATLKTAGYLSAITSGDSSAIPFTATIDRSGYVVSVTATFPTVVGTLTYQLALSGFGVANNVLVPADAIEAPPHLYG